MKRIAVLLLGLSFVGCTEYDLSDDGVVYGEPNPPDLMVPVRTDRHVQTPVPVVDILWVIDNSCSMEEEQSALTQNFPLFMNYFLGSGLDYHIGVVSTDMDAPSHKGKLRTVAGYKWIDVETPNPIAVYTQMAYMGINGSAEEKGRAAAYTALELRKNGYNQNFLREEASLHVVAISDENDHSGSNPVSLNEFIQYLLTLKWSSDMVTFSSITGPPSGCPTAYEPGTQYLSITQAVTGIEWSICEDEWGQVLDELGMQAAGLKREFYLSEVPVPGSIEVWVVDDGITYAFEEGEDWVYDRARNSIVFDDYVPMPLSEVFIQYEVLAAFQDEASGIGAEDTGAPE
jgi:hypothetical protein